MGKLNHCRLLFRRHKKKQNQNKFSHQRKTFFNKVLTNNQMIFALKSNAFTLEPIKMRNHKVQQFRSSMVKIKRRTSIQTKIK